VATKKTKSGPDTSSGEQDIAARFQNNVTVFPGGGDYGSIIERMNEEFAMIIVGDKTMILQEFEDSDGDKDIRFLSVDSFVKWMANKVYVTQEPAGRNGEEMKEVRIPYTKLWLSAKDRRQYMGLVFNPSSDPGRFYNMWGGFTVTPDPDPGNFQRKCPTFIDHILNNVASGDPHIYDWVMGWFAHMVQHPEERLGTALVIRGGQGSGKTTVGKVMGHLLGRHYSLADDPRYLLGQFNAHMQSCLLLQADEGFWAGDKKAEGRLKGLVTADRQYVEKKGVDPIMVKNRIHLMISSNHNFVVPAGMDERRFCVLDIGEEKKQDREYFGKLYDEMEAGGYEALLAWLMDFDLDSVDLAHIPKTEALLEQKLNSLDPVYQWWFECLRRGSVHISGADWYPFVKTRTALTSYQIHCEKTGIRFPLPDNQLAQMIKNKLAPGSARVRRTVMEDGVHSRAWGYTMPGLDECRAHFEDMIGHPMDWGCDETA
tara:strand:- start:1763 stop:3217 length:1455 start_codon:yes stop_codon:yes gene_type:complete